MSSPDPEIDRIIKEPCQRCSHTGHYHRLDDALNVGPGDPGAVFRCIWPAPEGWPPQCDCPDMVRAK